MIQDDLGTAYDGPRPALRVVSLVPSLTETLASVDRERLIGATEWCTHPADLTTTRDDLLSSTRKSQEAEDQARKRTGDLGILAGSVGATGPGIEVTIDDPKNKVDAAAMVDAVEELRDSGAEAIVINGTARVVAQTYFLDDVDSIRVGGREIKRPFIIEAIGDPSTMAEAVRIRGGLADKVQTRDGTVTISTRDKITITALADVKRPEYAQPSS